MDNSNHGKRNTEKGIIIFKTINICGLSERSKFSLNHYIHNENIGILALQELDTANKSSIQLPNMFCISDTNKGANKGSALYVKDTYSITNLDEISKMSTKIDSCWGMVMANNKKFIIGSVYVKADYPHAIKEVIQMLEKAAVLKKKLKAHGVILAGDFNARHLAWGDHKITRYGKDLVDNLDDTIFSICTSQTPTFLGAGGGNSKIDLFIMTNELAEKIDSCETDEEVELWTGAPQRGHLPLGIKLYSRKPKEVEVIKKLDISKMPWETWTETIEREITKDINYLEKEQNPYLLMNKLDSIISEATMKNGTFKNSCQHSKPFWNKDLSELDKVLRNARKTYIKRNTGYNLEKYEKAKENFDTARKEACQEFLINKTKNLNRAQMATFWKEFNSIFKKHSSQKIDPIEDGKNGLLTESEDINKCMFSVFFEGKHLEKEPFNEKFYDEVSTLYGDIKNNDYEDEGYYPEVNDLNQPVSMEEIKKAIGSKAKSVDNHNVHPKMLEHLGPKALKILQKIFNMCIEQKVWIWSEAKVIFLRKSGKDSYAKPGSYRPISITSYIGKLFEKIISRRIQKLLLIKNLTDPDQEGFTGGKNTIRYLNRLHMGIESDKEKNLTVLVLFVDFEKAYDSVWKKGLITKLFKLRIQGNILNLIDSFISKRKVALCINGKLGELRQTGEYGLPQGAVLSVQLFKIFLMDFAEELENIPEINKYKFADDGSIKVTGETTENCIKTFQKVLDCLNNWTKKWRMKINCNKDKTEVICFNTKEKNDDLVPWKFKLGENEIERVKKTKVLGLVMDDQLKFNYHTEEVLKSVRATWATLCKLSNRHWGLKQKVMVYLIKTMIVSKWSYASHIYMNKENQDLINKFWYKMLKALTGAVFNIKLEVAEVILGLPPLAIQNKINEIKHFLKLNIVRVPGDRYIEFLEKEYNEENKTPHIIHSKMKNVFEFLSWKTKNYRYQFTEGELNLIHNKSYGSFFTLSKLASSYTKGMINLYLENNLWKPVLQTQFQLEGYTRGPNPSIDILPIPDHVKRSTEILLMSFMYKNNLMNHFLWSLGRVESPRCHKCAVEVETPDHLLFNCNNIDKEIQAKILKQYKKANKLENQQYIDPYIGILNASRDEGFINSCIDLIETCNLREDIIL